LGGQPVGFRRPSLVFIFVKLAHNVLQIGDVAGLDALNFQLTTKDF
jgi:hypothetical protein